MTENYPTAYFFEVLFDHSTCKNMFYVLYLEKKKHNAWKKNFQRRVVNVLWIESS